MPSTEFYRPCNFYLEAVDILQMRSQAKPSIDHLQGLWQELDKALRTVNSLKKELAEVKERMSVLDRELLLVSSSPF